MSSHVIYVVAEHFRGFTSDSAVRTVDELTRGLADGTFPEAAADRVTLLPGQGVSGTDWDFIRDEVEARDLGERVALAANPGAPEKRQRVLKNSQRNVLLGELERGGEYQYSADLVIDDEAEVLQDQTAERQHVPGILLMDAACQMYIAGTGDFVRRKWPEQDFYLVMQEFGVSFERYVFPLPARLVMDIESADDSREGRVAFVLAISLTQAGRICARMRWRCMRIARDQIYAIEAKRAKEALDGAIAADTVAVPA